MISPRAPSPSRASFPISSRSMSKSAQPSLLKLADGAAELAVASAALEAPKAAAAAQHVILDSAAKTVAEAVSAVVQHDQKLSWLGTRAQAQQQAARRCEHRGSGCDHRSEASPNRGLRLGDSDPIVTSEDHRKRVPHRRGGTVQYGVRGGELQSTLRAVQGASRGVHGR